MSKDKEKKAEEIENTEEVEQKDGEGEREEWVTVFTGDLHNCKERLEILQEEGIEAIVEGDIEDSVQEVGVPIFQLKVQKKDLEEVAEIFAEIWEEILETEGIGEISDEIVDLSKDKVICPGCKSEIEEVTEDGECPECGLFLGFPPEEEGEEESEEK